MGTSDSRREVPTWAAALVVLLTVTTVVYVFVYGGRPAAPLMALFGAIGVGLSVITVYLAYRFVVAVEEIAEKH